MDCIFIYPNETGGIVWCSPSPDCGLTIEQIAAKDVPAGVPYLIIPNEDAPMDHTFFNAFEADFSNPHGYGGNFGNGTDLAVVGWTEDGKFLVAEKQVNAKGLEYVNHEEAKPHEE